MPLSKSPESAISVHSSLTTSVHGIPDTANLVVGTDARLSDARIPLAHTHTKSNITDFTHTHSQSDVNNLVSDLDGKVSKNSALATPELGITQVLPSRTSGYTNNLYSNGIAAGAGASVASKNIHLSPIWFSKSAILNKIVIRADGGAFWATNPAIQFKVGIYTNGEEGLPSVLLKEFSELTIPANAGANSWQSYNLSVGDQFNLMRGSYWVAFLNNTASSFSLAGIETSSGFQVSYSTLLLSAIIGIGENQTSIARAIATSIGSGDTELPANLDSRFLDMNFSTASQSTLRVRSNTPIISFGYEVGLVQPFN